MAKFPCGPGVCPVYLDTIGQSKSHSNPSSAGQESLSSRRESLPVTCCSVAVYQITLELSVLNQCRYVMLYPRTGSEMQAGLCRATLLHELLLEATSGSQLADSYSGGSSWFASQVRHVGRDTWKAGLCSTAM